MNQKKIVLGVTASAILGLILVFFYLTYWRYIETTDNAYIQADISVMSAKITGYVQDIPIAENQPVKKGDLLLTIKLLEFSARVKEADASIELAKASLRNVNARLELQSSKIREAQANIEDAQAELQRAKKDYDRTVDLVKSNIMSQKQLDQADAAYLKAAASLKSTTAAYEAAQQQIPVLKTEYQQNEAKLAQVQSQKLVAQDDLNNTRILAPIDGIIGNKIVQSGQLVRPGQQLLSVVPCNPYIYANFKETQLARMKKGQKAKITVDAYSGQLFSGHIDSLSPASGAVFSLLPPENATGNFTKIVQRIPIKIVFDDLPSCYFIRPGMSVVVKIDTRE